MSAQSSNVASTVLDYDLVEVCKHAAAKLGIAWPVTPGNPAVKWDIYDRKRLPQEKQLLPDLPVCIAEMNRSWDKLFSHRVPIKGYLSLNVSEIEGLGLSYLPRSSSKWLTTCIRTGVPLSHRPAPPSLGFTTSIYQNMYKSSALAMRALNVHLTVDGLPS